MFSTPPDLLPWFASTTDLDLFALTQVSPDDGFTVKVLDMKQTIAGWPHRGS
jgi:hypothetical protein